MVDLRKYYNDRAVGLAKSEHFLQVGHSVNGEPISDSEFQYIIRDIISILDLNSNDTLLDLCCGNGLLTIGFAKTCARVIGLDFSKELISVAQENYSSNNVSYIRCDVIEAVAEFPCSIVANKVLMFGALQHFDLRQFKFILSQLKKNLPFGFVVLFGFVPDSKFKWKFYSSTLQRLKYFYRLFFKKDVMGTWWDRGEMENFLYSSGFNFEFFDLAVGRYGHPYRFYLKVESA